jgi:hypothetical protein
MELVSQKPFLGWQSDTNEPSPSISTTSVAKRYAKGSP